MPSIVAYETTENASDVSARTRTSSSRRGPWTPSTRESSMSEVADGPGDERHRAARPRAGRRRAGGSRPGPVDDLALLDDAQVEVGNQREGAAALPRARIEDKRPGLGDREGAAGEGGADLVEVSTPWPLVDNRVQVGREPLVRQIRRHDDAVDPGSSTDAADRGRHVLGPTTVTPAP